MSQPVKSDKARHLIQSSAVVIALFVLEKIGGFGRLFLITGEFGASGSADAFTAASQLPELLFAMLAGGALGAALVPVYSSYLSHHSKEEQDQMAHTVMTLILVASGGLSLLGVMFAPWLVRVVLAPDFTPELQQLTARLMQISLLSYVILGISGTISALLNAHKHFILPAASLVMMDLGGMFGLGVLAPRMGIEGAAWGIVLGACLHLLIQVPAVIKYGITFWPRINLHLEGIREVIRLMGPRIITLGLWQAADLFVIRVGSQLPEGHLAIYFYAVLLANVPSSLFAWAVGGVIFPTMAEEYHANDNKGFRQTAVTAVRVLWFLLIPSAVGLIALGRQGIAFLFERGEFDADATALLYTIIIVLTVRMFLDGLLTVLERLFFARHNTHTVMWAFAMWSVVYVAATYLLVPRIGVTGLALASVLAFVVMAVRLFWLQHRTTRDLEPSLLLLTLRRCAISAVAMAGFITLLRQAPISDLIFVLLAIPLGGIVYVATYALVGGRENLLTMVRLILPKTAPHPL